MSQLPNLRVISVKWTQRMKENKDKDKSYQIGDNEIENNDKIGQTKSTATSSEGIRKWINLCENKIILKTWSTHN